MSIKAVLFDFDGTLVHSIDLIVKLFMECFQEQGVEEINESNIRKMIGEPLEKIARKFSKLINVQKFVASFREKEALLHHTIEFTEKTLPTLESLKSQNLRLGIISTKPRHMIEKYLQEKGVANFFEILIGGDDVQNPKPDPEPILLACKKMDLQKNEVIFVGDSLMDCLSAKNTGVIFVGVLTGTANREELEENGAAYIFQNIGEISGLIQKISNSKLQKIK